MTEGREGHCPTVSQYRLVRFPGNRNARLVDVRFRGGTSETLVLPRLLKVIAIVTLIQDSATLGLRVGCLCHGEVQYEA